MSTPHPDEPHGTGLGQRLNWLRAGVLGANDGIVSVASLVVGVAGATSENSALLVAGARRVGTALSLTAIYAGSALAFSGGTLPLNGASWLAVGWSAILPYPHYLALAMDQALGSPPALARRCRRRCGAS